MKVACIGNIAGNGYLLARSLRALGVEADSFDLGGGQPMWLPWWDEVDFAPESIHPAHYDWVRVAEETGWKRPAWAKILGVHGDPAWYDTQEEYQADFVRMVPAAVHGETGETTAQHDAEAAAALARGRLSPEEQAQCVRGLRDVACWRSIVEIARHYDLLLLTGPFAGCGVVVPKEVPYVTFEHSTMRMVPLLDKPERLLLAYAYRYADANVLTNADCREAAWMLGLDPARLCFIPHPVDTDLFCPTPPEGDAESAEYRRRILEGVPGGAELIFYAPARQSNNAETGAKRNDRIFYAFSHYLSTAEAKGAPKAVLIAGGWGDPPQIAQSVALMARLGIAERTILMRSQPKRRVRALYRAADVVIDQFDAACGSFGTVTAEALSSGRPVVTHINPDAHDWCADRMPVPPVCPALTAQEVYAWLTQLATDPDLRAEIGAVGRRWVEEYHTGRRTAEDHRALYHQVLALRAADEAPEPVRELVEAAG